MLYITEPRSIMYNSRPMGEKHFSGGQIHPVLRKVLASALLVDGIAVVVSMLWMFRRIESGLGDDLAEVALTLIFILVMALVLVGMRAGMDIDRYIRRRKLENFRIYRSSRQVRSLCSLLGYGPPLPQDPQLEPRDEDLLGLVDKPRQRGRPPTHSIDRWKKVVLAWDNRDTLHKPLTLAEFLAEEFGTYADGSPCMSENSFYDWRRKVYQEVRRKTEGTQTRA